jgi:hypothetical protein
MPIENRFRPNKEKVLGQLDKPEKVYYEDYKFPPLREFSGTSG